MCGIAAALGPIATGQVAQMMESMAYRGIRSKITGCYGGALGHVRLPIVGVEMWNDQPVRQGYWTIAFVGEILDFRDQDPSIECDLQIVVSTWVDKGPRGFCDFDGFWAIVAHDARDGALHLLVDYLAQKPLYARIDDGIVAIASELDAIAGLAPVTLDPIYLSAVVKWGYCPEPERTPYLGVQKVPPGGYVVLGPEGVRYRARTDPLRATPLQGMELRVEVEKAVRRRVGACDVPLACLVSGGLDSSITWTLASRYGDLRPYHAANGELEWARQVVPRVEELPLNMVSLPRALCYMQEPIDLGSLVPQVALSDAISRAGGERVCLTGDGADELFGGYGRVERYDSQASDVWHELVQWHLPRLDRVMMRNRIEVRSPFLARRVAGAALALPYSERIGKKILRDLFRRDLPPGVADRPKRALRVSEVETDRELRSRELVRLFKGDSYAATPR